MGFQSHTPENNCKQFDKQFGLEQSPTECPGLCSLDMVSRPVTRPVDVDPHPVRSCRAQRHVRPRAAVRTHRASFSGALDYFLCLLLCSHFFLAHEPASLLPLATVFPSLDAHSSPCLSRGYPFPLLHPRLCSCAALLSLPSISSSLRQTLAVPSLHAPLRAPRPCSSPHLCSADQCSWFSSRDRSEFPPHAPCVAPTF